MKKKILILVLVVSCIFIIYKGFCAYVLIKASESLEKFRQEENRTYSVSTFKDENFMYKSKNYIRDNFIKCITVKDSDRTFIDCIDKNNEINYFLDQKNNYAYVNCSFINSNVNFLDIPKILKNKSLKNLFGVHYIIPTTYNNKTCYKIVTKTETVIIDRETYLPVYCLSKYHNSESGDGTIERTYEFSVGTVTDEDVALPDLEGYEIIEE